MKPGSARPNQRLQEASGCSEVTRRSISAEVEDRRARNAPSQPECGLAE